MAAHMRAPAWLHPYKGVKGGGMDMTAAQDTKTAIGPHKEIVDKHMG